MTDGTTTWTYTYNADGLRTQRTNGTTTYHYVYNGSSLTQMTVGSDTLYFTDDTVTYNGTVYYYVKNIQGDIIAILDSAGVAVVEYSYDAWGNILSTTGELANTLGQANPLRYRGYVYDTETGLYYLQSRYYDPEVGRFLNADAFASTGQGILGNNMFAYCGNNPVNYSDPLGGYSRSIGSDLRAAHVDRPGSRWNALAELQLSANVEIPEEVYTIAQILLNIAASAIEDAFTPSVPEWYSSLENTFAFWAYYDEFRFEGLGNWDSFKGAFIFSLGFGGIESIPVVGDIIGYVAGDYMDIIVANYVTYHRPSPVEAARNISNYVATKGAAVGVGGLMCVTAFGQLEVRELHGMH